MRPVHKSRVQKDLQDLKPADMLALAASLKQERIGSLELFIVRDERPRYTFLSIRHAGIMLTFTRALAWAVSTGGSLQHLELGFCLSARDLQLLAHAICLSKTLKHLSFANSCLGDDNLQMLAKCLRDCVPLEILSLSGCNLTDAAAPVLASILKANLSRKIQEDWQHSLREYKPKPNANQRIHRSGLKALDLSWNKLTAASMKAMCTIFRLGPSIEALDVKGNKLELECHKLFHDVMKEWGILKFVDLRQNEDSSLLSVINEGGQQHFMSTRSHARGKKKFSPRRDISSRRNQHEQLDCLMYRMQEELETQSRSSSRYNVHSPPRNSSRYCRIQEVDSPSRSISVSRGDEGGVDSSLRSAEIIQESCRSIFRSSGSVSRQEELYCSSRGRRLSTITPPGKQSRSPERISTGTNTSLSESQEPSAPVRSSLGVTPPLSPATKLICSVTVLKEEPGIEEEEEAAQTRNGEDAAVKTVESHAGEKTADDLGDKTRWSTAIPKQLDFDATTQKRETEWNAFLTDISRALLQLNDRLDKLIGPSGTSSQIRTELLSKLNALD